MAVGRRNLLGLARRIPRRSFLKITGTAAGIAATGAVARSAPVERPTRQFVHVYLPGGPSPLDTFDMKPDASSDVRGEFRPIRTNVAGVRICELLPRLARLADTYSIVRGIRAVEDEHTSRQAESGWDSAELAEQGGRPGMTAVLAALEQEWLGTEARVPPAVDFGGWTNRGFLGSNVAVRDASQLPAFELDDVHPRTRSRYALDAHPQNKRFLAARQLLTAGVRAVGLAWGFWDTHGNNFGQLRQRLPAFDAGLASLLEDLRSSGKLDETVILVSGEFGRTPAINDGAGRDHWLDNSFALLAGGGMRHGQVIGRTDRTGAFPADRPRHVQEVLATAYRAAGVDGGRLRLRDRGGRLRAPLRSEHRPLAELV